MGAAASWRDVIGFSLVKESWIKEPSACCTSSSVPGAAGAAGGHGDEQSIAQACGVVTSVLWAASGVNVAAKESGASYGIKGSIKGVKAMWAI